MKSHEMQHICIWGRSLKVSPSGPLSPQMGTLVWSIAMKCMRSFMHIPVIILPPCQTSLFSQHSQPSRDGKWLAVRDWLQNAKSVMYWSRSASTSYQDWMFCSMKCTWRCHTCLCLFWWMSSTTSLSGKPFQVALSRDWSHYWRQMASIFGKN